VLYVASKNTDKKSYSDSCNYGFSVCFQPTDMFIRDKNVDLNTSNLGSLPAVLFKSKPLISLISYNCKVLRGFTQGVRMQILQISEVFFLDILLRQ